MALARVMTSEDAESPATLVDSIRMLTLEIVNLYLHLTERPAVKIDIIYFLATATQAIIFSTVSPGAFCEMPSPLFSSSTISAIASSHLSSSF